MGSLAGIIHIPQRIRVNNSDTRVYEATHVKSKHGLDCDPEFASLFNSADANNDGELDQTEFRRLLFESAKTDWDWAHTSTKEINALFWHLDTSRHSILFIFLT